MKASNAAAGDGFGLVAISGETIVVGAPGEDSKATGINGNQSDNGAQSSGAAYIFSTNATPSIVAAAGVTRVIGSPSISGVIATVADTNDPAGSLIVTVNGGASASLNGISISNIVNTGGVITASIAAGCGAAAGATAFALQVSDGVATATATLSVVLSANPAPTLTYNTSTVNSGSTVTVGPDTGPADNGLLSSIAIQSPGTYTGTVTVNSTTGVVSISDAAPVGTHTFVVRAIDNCGAVTDASLTLVVTSGGGTDPVTGGSPSISLPSSGVISPGSPVTLTQTLTNNTSSPVTTSYVATLPDGVVAIACASPVGSCVIGSATVIAPGSGLAGLARRSSLNATASRTVTWTGTIPGNGSVTITYQVQVSVQAVGGMQYCVTTAIGGVTGATTCLTVNTPLSGPGNPPIVAGLPSQQKPGSVLIFNIYASSISNTQSETLISLTNTNPVAATRVHLFFIDGATCATADQVVTLTANQTASFRASDIDPGVVGYLIAVAVDESGCPTISNYLIGMESVRFESGHHATLAAIGVAGIGAGALSCPVGSTTTRLVFDGIGYDALPRSLAVASLPALANGNSPLLIVNRIGGDLTSGAARLGSLAGLLFDDREAARSFTLAAGTCQLRGLLGNNLPRTVPRYTTVIPAGRTGWMKFWAVEDEALSGVLINEAVSGLSGGYSLQTLTTTSAATLTIPVIPN